MSTPTYTPAELEQYWEAKCPRCGWKGLSRDCEGGGQIADTGDYGDVICPECVKDEGRPVPVVEA